MKSSIRNVAYALLSGADGWMFDGEDALGLTGNMLLDNQRNLKLAISKDPVFMQAAENVAVEINRWAQGFFGNEDILYLMEDMATGEIRLSILWEWVNKAAEITEDDPETGVKSGDVFSVALFERLLEEEYGKLLKAGNRDVHDDSKTTTLPISRKIVSVYTLSETKLPWFIDLLNINLNNLELGGAKNRIQRYMEAFKKDEVEKAGFGNDNPGPAFDDAKLWLYNKKTPNPFLLHPFILFLKATNPYCLIMHIDKPYDNSSPAFDDGRAIMDFHVVFIFISQTAFSAYY